MAGFSEEKLLEAIQKDDIKAFDALMENAQCGAYRLGRFPVLSLLYLYKSKKIIAVYEEKFIKTEAWEALKEPAGIAKAFSEKAGKCLRLYLNEVVSPLEMLLILDETKKLKRVYPSANPSNAVKERLQSIYSVKYSLDIKYEGNDIIIDRRPLSRREKKRVATIALCSLLAVAVAVAAPVTTLSLLPKKDNGKTTVIGPVDFSKKTTYTLTEDLVIPEKFSVDKVNCSIVGGGHKLVFEKGATLGEFSGKISDTIIESSGSPLFTSISEKGEISNVTVNVTADVQTSSGTAFITIGNYGAIDSVIVNVSGKVNAVAPSSAVTALTTFGGIANFNYYKRSETSSEVYGIRNCTVNYSDFTLEGEVYANAIFGGIVGINNGVVQDCSVTGKIGSTTFDLSGVCAVNNGLLSGDKNEANLSQISTSEEWNPVVAGITYNNANTIEKCINYGALTAEGSGSAICGGIAAYTTGGIEYCLSTGDIEVAADTAYVGGIFGRSEIVKDAYGKIYCGTAQYCISENKITVSTEETACAGGIGGYVLEGCFVNYDEILGYFGGGITKCFFLGSNTKEINYFGNIIGACGANIYYEADLYYSDYHNFENNFYVDNLSSTCGATIVWGEDNKEHYAACSENIGATAASEEVIIAMQAYRDILDKIGN